jgi:hypothetical protein
LSEIKPLLEIYFVDDTPVTVVREDMTTPFPAPNNSKVRGIEAYLLRLREEGVKKVASQDTRISRIGWGISWLCNQYDIIHYNFYPELSPWSMAVPFYQKMSKHFNGNIIPLHGTFASAFRSLAMKWLVKNNIEAHYIPIGASVTESVVENAKSISRLSRDLLEGTVVTSVSSGTICSGLWYGMMITKAKGEVHGVLSSSFHNRLDKIKKLVLGADALERELEFGQLDDTKIKLVDLGFEYREEVKEPPPFPCDMYLDRKAWSYIVNNVHNLKKPILMWNIGGEFDPIVGLKDGLRGDGIVRQSDIDEIMATME